MLSERELLAATKPFTVESRLTSWWHVISTLALISGTLTLAALAPWWQLQLAASIFGALFMVRGFILFHDFAHGAILRKSVVARVVLSLYSMLFFAGVSYWREAHNFHHAHVSQMGESCQGSFPIMTLAEWQNATFMQRLYYRVNRNPITMLLAYITVFFFSNTLDPFLRQPIKHWTSGASIFVHVGVIAFVWWAAGPMATFFAFFLPYSLAAALGAYLFYAQHNFPEMEVLPPEEWSRTSAALRSTSYMRLNRFLDWCTGSIGFHHVHHLNSSIPFYRLREAMQAIPDLQRAPVTTLRPWDMWRCLRLKLWDEVDRRMLTWREARQAMRLRTATA